jgi:hypothetical protein
MHQWGQALCVREWALHKQTSAGEGEPARAIASKSERLQTSRGQWHEQERVQHERMRAGQTRTSRNKCRWGRAGKNDSQQERATTTSRNSGMNKSGCSTNEWGQAGWGPARTRAGEGKPARTIASKSERWQRVGTAAWARTGAAQMNKGGPDENQQEHMQVRASWQEREPARASKSERRQRAGTGTASGDERRWWKWVETGDNERAGNGGIIGESSPLLLLVFL